MYHIQCVRFWPRCSSASARSKSCSCAWTKRLRSYGSAAPRTSPDGVMPTSCRQTLRIRRAGKRGSNPACWHSLTSSDASACDVEHAYHGALGGIPRCDRLGSRKQLDRASLRPEILGGFLGDLDSATL